MKKGLLVASILYIAITILCFYPNLNTLNSSLIGPPEDNMAHYWTLWYFGNSLLTKGLDSMYIESIFYPQGSSLIYQALSPYNILLSLFLKMFINLILVYNLLIWLTFLISGLGVYLLVYYLTKNPLASIVAGFIFAFNPSHFAHSLHHIEISSIQFLPFFMLYFMKSMNSSSLKYLLLATLFFLLLSLTTLYYFVLTAIFIFLSYIYLALKKRKAILKHTLLKIAIIIGTTTLILSPLLIKMVTLGSKHSHEIGAWGYNTMVVDLFSIFTPHSYHFLASNRVITNINSLLSGNPWEKTAYLGIVNIFIVIFALPKISKDSKRYFLGLFSFLILSMGSYLHIMGLKTSLILPYRIIEHIPVLLSMRTPARAVVYVYLFWSIIVGLSITNIMDSNLKRKRLVLSLILPLVFLDFLSFSYYKTEVFEPQVYREIKREEDEFGILDLPAKYYPFSSYYMMYQTYHNIPMVGGYISRKLNKTLIDYLDYDNIDKQREQLIENRVKYVVIHKLFFDPENITDIIKPYLSNYSNIYEDRTNILLKVY